MTASAPLAALLLTALVAAARAFPAAQPVAEDQQPQARFPGFPGFPGAGIFNPLYAPLAQLYGGPAALPQLYSSPALPQAPQGPQFPFFIPPFFPLGFPNSPAVSPYNLGGSGSGSGISSSSSTSSGSVSTYGLQNDNGHLTGGGLVVVANPNGTVTTYEIVLRPVNTTAAPGVPTSPASPAESAATVVPEVATETVTEVVGPEPKEVLPEAPATKVIAKEVVSMVPVEEVVDVVPAKEFVAMGPAELVAEPPKTVRREALDQEEAAEEYEEEYEDELEA